MSFSFYLGQLAAMEKLGIRSEARKRELEAVGIRTLPPLRTKVRSENEPIVQPTPWKPPETKNPFDEFDELERGRRRAKFAAFGGGIFKNISGPKPLGMPTAASQILKAPKPQTGAMPSLGGVRMPKPPGAIDPRASKPPGMNLQHQVQDNAHTIDSANSMSSPQRRFVSPL